jgi:ATP-dependent exoDNAse (exonuclease V) beta subunit
VRKHISFSELKTWDECAYKHKLIYLDNIKEFQGNEYTAFGTALHEVCERSVLGEISSKKEDLLECFNIKFLEEVKSLIDKGVTLDKNMISEMRTQAAGIVEHIMPALKDFFGEFEVVSAEEQLLESVEDYEKKFKGFIDLIIKTKDGKYHVIDWKSCSWGWDTRKKSDRMTTYQLVYYKHFFSKKHNIKVSDIETYFALLKRTAKKNRVEIFKVTSGAKKTDNALKLLNKGLYNIENKIFVKNKLSCTSGYGCEFYGTKHCSR